MNLRLLAGLACLFLLSVTVSGQNIPAKYADLIERIKSINRNTTIQQVMLTNEELVEDIGHS